jgi:uncharacterized protein (DUF58 family)
MLVTLAGLEAEGGTDFVGALGGAVDRIRRRGLTVVLSDFMDEPERIAKVISRLRHRGSDAIAMRVYDPSERALAFSSLTRFHDLEGEQILALDPQVIQEDYRQTFDTHEQELADACRRHGFDHAPLPVADDWDAPLFAYIRRRAEMLS